MRRLFAIATMVLFLGSIPVWAQRGGGRASSGGHGGMTGHAGGGASFSGSRGGMRSGAGPAAQGFNRGSSFRGSSFRNSSNRGSSNFHPPSRGSGFQRFRGPRIRNFNSRNCFGCRRGFGSPFGYAGLYDPYWWWDSHSSYDEGREREYAQASEMNQQSLEEQRQRRDDDQDLYARSDPSPQQRDAERTETPAPATVLVFRDQRKQEVQNYAIVGQTLWVFASQHTQKIPLVELDMAATTKANDDRGVDFRVPSVNEAQ